MPSRPFSRLIFFAAIAAFFSFSSTASAQSNSFESNAEGMTLSPPSFEVTLKPGEETAYTIRITNPTKNLIELYPSAGNFTASGEGGEPKYEIGEKAIENNSQFSIANWVSFFEPKIALLPEQVVEFRFRIKVPENAEPGGHYGVVFLGTKPPNDKTSSSQVSLSTMVGSLLLVRIPGDVHEEAAIDEFSIPWFFFSPPVEFTTYLKNTGNVHVRPKGDIIVSNWRGREETRIDINPTKGSVLPESRRKFDASWNHEAKYFWETPIGRFHATLKIDYGESHRELSRTVIFWIIPKWLIVTIIILLLIIILFIIFIFRRKKRREQMLRRKNGGFFPAFSQKVRFNSQKEPSENNKIQPIGRTQGLKMENSELGRSQKEIPLEETSFSMQQYNSASLQRIRESNEPSKQFRESQKLHPIQENSQTSSKNRKRRLV